MPPTDLAIRTTDRATIPQSARELTSLSIVLPCFNEEPNINRAITEALVAGREVADVVEVIVVDDGSTDRTRLLAEARALAGCEVRVVAHDGNRGYGAAVRSGLRAARMDWILLTDGDLQFEMAELRDVTPLAGDADIVAGFRIVRMDPFHRRANAAAWNWLVRRIFKIPVRDVDCAFKLMRRSLVQGLDLSAEGAMVSTELLARAGAAGASIVEAGVHHRPREAGEATGASPRVILRAFRELAVIARRMHDEQAGREVLAPPAPAVLGG